MPGHTRRHQPRRAFRPTDKDGAGGGGCLIAAVNGNGGVSSPLLDALVDATDLRTTCSLRRFCGHLGYRLLRAARARRQHLLQAPPAAAKAGSPAAGRAGDAGVSASSAGPAGRWPAGGGGIVVSGEALPGWRITVPLVWRRADELMSAARDPDLLKLGLLISVGATVPPVPCPPPPRPRATSTVPDRGNAPGFAGQIACGGYHSAVVTDGGRVFSWGFNRYGQCGNGSKDNTVGEPAPVVLSEIRPPGLGKNPKVGRDRRASA